MAWILLQPIHRDCYEYYTVIYAQSFEIKPKEENSNWVESLEKIRYDKKSEFVGMS